jgi:hypothetical protein
MLRNLGAPIHCFEQLMRAFFLRSSLITTTESAHDLAPSTFEIRRGQASYGVIRKLRAHGAKSHMTWAPPLRTSYSRKEIFMSKDLMIN